MRDAPPPLPFEAAMAHAPEPLLPLLGPLVRGIATEDISHVGSLPETIGPSMLGTVGRDSPVENTRENTPGNIPTPQATDLSFAAGAAGPARARDAALLFRIVQLRIASIQQLAKAMFPNVSIVVARRRIRALQRDGWVRTWDRPVPSGGAPRYVYPTPRALQWAFPRLVELVRDGAAERLIRLMIPDSTKRLTQLGDGAEPQWFAHQDEINRLVLARVHAAGERVVWSSAWDCPFPDRLNGLKAPQPDYVLVTPHEDGAHVLLFGEHDRASEPLARWGEKLAAYAAAYELSEELFGYASFTVDVSVVDPVGRRPLKRLKAIADGVREAGCSRFVRLTLAGWLHALPHEAIWFSDGAVPNHGSMNPREHSNTST